jgi:hypothetical protein
MKAVAITVAIVILIQLFIVAPSSRSLGRVEETIARRDMLT